jgi:spermidine/putrescine transport system ATP-binding protein
VGDFAAPGTVRTRSYQGSDTVYTVGTDRWGDVVADVRGSDFDVGDSVTVAWDAEDVHLFRAGSGGETAEPEPREAT